MKYSNINLLCLIIILSLFINCSSKINNTESGLIHFAVNEYDSNNKFVQTHTNDMPMEFRAWYKDSFVIEEIRTFKIRIENNSSNIIRVIAYYVFVDLKSGYYYYYRNLSDTAKPFKKNFKNENGISGINFHAYNKAKQDSSVVSVDPLKDTIIKNISFVRYKVCFKDYDTMGNIKFSYKIAYGRCDKKEFIFNMGNGYSNQISCPITRLDPLERKKGINYWFSNEIEFLRDTLTNQENNIFKAWERNAKLNPVK